MPKPKFKPGDLVRNTYTGTCGFVPVQYGQLALCIYKDYNLYKYWILPCGLEGFDSGYHWEKVS